MLAGYDHREYARRTVGKVGRRQQGRREGFRPKEVSDHGLESDTSSVGGAKATP